MSDDKTVKAPAMGEFSLLISGSRKTYLRFETLEELRAAIGGYLTKSEINSGILDKLTDFRPGRVKDAMIENKWRNFSVCAYVLD